MITLRGMRCSPVWSASGAQGFFGEGYPYHRFLKTVFRRRFSFEGVTLVPKTTTLNERKGNLPLKKDSITPREWFPRCIIVKPLKGVVLNAVGLSGPGARALFETGRWQTNRDPVILSFMSIENSEEGRFKELEEYVRMLLGYLPGFKGQVGLQINKSCPNVGLKPDKLVHETHRDLDLIGLRLSRRIPIIMKFNALLPIRSAKEIAEHPRCDGLCISNSIPWGTLPSRIGWKELFGSDVSPLAHLGGGGLSGAPLLPIVRDWVADARSAGISKHINAGGGILCSEDVQTLFRAGASSVFVGSVVMLRPWRLASIVRTAYLAALK